MIVTRVQAGAACALAAILTLAGVVTASAQQPVQISEDAVKKYMDYAWEMLPDKFTKPDGAVVKIDKSDRTKIDVPVEVGRDAVLAGRRSAYAQACGFAEEQIANYRSLMIREEGRKKWSDAQMMFINQIHMTTGMLLNGTIRLVETDAGGKEVKVEEETAPKIKVKDSDPICNEILAQIKDYVEKGPPIPYNPKAQEAAAKAPAAAPAAATPPATTGTTPVKKP